MRKFPFLYRALRLERQVLHALRLQERGEATLAVLVILGLQIGLREKLTLGLNWWLPALELMVLIPLIALPDARTRQGTRTRLVLCLSLIGIITLSNFYSVAQLVYHLLTGSKASGARLFVDAVMVWGTNVLLFGLWYWELDARSLSRRDAKVHRDFLFPQHSSPDYAPPNWRPGFLDYLFVAFTNATAFSPTDTLPLSARAKLLMMVQAAISLVTVALVAARAVNVLP